MTADSKLTTITELTAARHGGTPEEAAESQLLQREHLIAAIGKSIDFARLSDRSVGLLMVQLVRPDKLEAIVGTPAADLMNNAMRRLAGALRPADRFAAASGDKLVVVLPNLKSAAQAWLAADKVRRTLEEGLLLDHPSIVVRPLVGIASFPEHATLAEELIVHADIAVGVAAKRDVSQHEFHDEDRIDAEIYLGLEAPLRNAIHASQLALRFYPQLDLKSGKCVAASAVVHWDAPDFGVVSPASIVRIAEIGGTIGALSNWLVNTAFRQQAEWKKLGLNIQIGIHLSAVSAADAEFPGLIQQAAGTWQTDCTRITFELAESQTRHDVEQTRSVLTQLKALGFKLVIDNFGSGLCSLSWLQDFPFDGIKFGRLLTQHLHADGAGKRIVQSVTDLGHHLHLTVAANAVDNDELMRDLKKSGCDLAQGNAVSPALTATQLGVWLRARP